LEELNKVMLSLWADDPEIDDETKWQLKGFCSDLNPQKPFEAQVLKELEPYLSEQSE
jgi:hypothetical protein